MSDIKWYADESARRTHAAMSKELAGVIERLCPGHELSHFGINRNPFTEEVILKLHLNPIGSVRVTPSCDPLLPKD